MSTLAELTDALGGDSAEMRAEMALSEKESLRQNLSLYKNLKTAYDNMLTRNGYRTAVSGVAAVIDGRAIRTINGGVYHPRGRLQVLGFRRINGWVVWTDAGLALVDESSSDALIIQPYQWAP